MNDTFIKLLKSSKKSIYSISKTTGVSYTALNQLANQKRCINGMAAETVARIADYFDTTVEKLLDRNSSEKNMDMRLKRILYDNFSYDEFRSELQHYLQHTSIREFMSAVLTYHLIEKLWDQKRYPESLYILSLFDYYAYKYKADSSAYFKTYREQRLKETLFPKSIVMLDAINHSDEERKAMLDKCNNNECSRFFLQHNIAEIMEI